MPNNVVKTKRQERLWKKAEGITKKKFGTEKGHYDYVMAIYKGMGGLDKKPDLKESFIDKVRTYLNK